MKAHRLLIHLLKTIEDMNATRLSSGPVELAPPNPMSGLVNRLLAIPPLWNFAKSRARTMMIKRAESIGVPWRDTVQQLQRRQTDTDLSPEWEIELSAITDSDLTYPAYYTTSFHAYEEGNLGWRPALEVEVAAKAVHARIWPEAAAQGDAKLRQSYHDVLTAQLPVAPTAIADLGCGVGMSTRTLRDTFPGANVTGVDLSPYFLAVAQYYEKGREGARERGREQEQQRKESRSEADRANTENLTPSLLSPPSSLPTPITWHHAAAEATHLPAGAFDLVSACLMFHELPQSAAISIIQEARRLLRPGGHLAIMDMNPRSEVFTKMPAFVLTLLKSTEPYLDEYMTLDFEQAFRDAGFEPVSTTCNSPRHRTMIARAV